MEASSGLDYTVVCSSTFWVRETFYYIVYSWILPRNWLQIENNEVILWDLGRGEKNIRYIILTFSLFLEIQFMLRIY